MKVLSYERTRSHHKYVVSAKDGHSVEVLYRLRHSPVLGATQAEGGLVSGWSRTEEVQAFREASDWLSRFLNQDGSPRPTGPLAQFVTPPTPEADPGD